MIKFNAKNLKIVDINKVHPNTWNPKDKNTEEFEKVVESIKINGQRSPVVVRENNGYEIIDGEQRYTACKQLDFKKVLIYNEGKISDKEAKELTIWYQQQVPFNEVKLAGMIKELLDQYELEEIQLPYSSEEIIEYAKMHDFNWEDYEYKDIELVTNKKKEKKKEENKEYYVSITKTQLKKIISKNKIEGCKLKPEHFEILKNGKENRK